MCERGPGCCTFWMKGAVGLSCSPAPADRPGPKRHELAKAGGERECEKVSGSCPAPSFGNQNLSPAGTRCRKLTSHLVPAGVPTANYRPAIFCRRSPAAVYSLGVEPLVEVSGRARDGSEEERRSGRDGTATAATCPAVLRGEPDPGRAARSYPRSALVVRP